MLDKIAKHFEFQQKSLNLRAYRAEVLASNLANDDTPNYKAVDFDFGQALSAAQSQQGGTLAMVRTSAAHLDGAAGTASDKPNLAYRNSVQPSLDGNSVDMDVERAAFTDNSLRYQSTLTFLNRRITGLADAIKGGQ
ncbi:flagellar basal body rod protein FlgB [Craterilacuibacter sinensis]|uniref:Flagellar basal body rod protein FlgB n=1 Tax=Craterilacuibacter sinensis TaxID=2686017 RepID=A0A845BRG9_9NEIS|nr:flagellar basal body rod protein FlgB [Craterilacuibacter sinensis]MXR36816.1 flagellar basal body rod protein FlgB [Craterilacuibacter sinensis]RQW29212.1 flagellar basal body rod protein FlgB [Rhodobacteraceae bacterium CH30]